ncbi:MAG: hypothetical protein AB1424_06050 [Thermodesulfobacteriota bacterium]
MDGFFSKDRNRLKVSKLSNILTIRIIIENLFIMLPLLIVAIASTVFTIYFISKSPSGSLSYPGDKKFYSVQSDTYFFGGYVAVKGNGIFKIIEPVYMEPKVWVAYGNDEIYWESEGKILHSFRMPNGSTFSNYKEGTLKVFIDIPDLNIKEPLEIKGYLEIPCIIASVTGKYYHNKLTNVKSKLIIINLLPKYMRDDLNKLDRNGKISLLVTFLSWITIFFTLGFYENKHNMQ